MAISLCHKNIPISSITFFELAFCETLDNKANWVWSACKRNIYFYFFIISSLLLFISFIKIKTRTTIITTRSKTLKIKSVILITFFEVF